MSTTIHQVNTSIEDLNIAVRSKDFSEELKNLTGDTASYLINQILGLSEWMDDSISNPYIGNIFDRQENTPVNFFLQYLANLYDVKQAFVSTNGTTPLNTAAVLSVAEEKQPIIIGRDSHVSVHAGVTLSGSIPIYVTPQYNSDLGILHCVTSASVEEALHRHPNTKAVVLTLPTYHGLIGNVSAISKVCKHYGVPLMIDEAHGPHLHILKKLGFDYPLSAEASGADVITQSTHKVLPKCLNQGSVALFNNEQLFQRFEEATSLGFQSTSFSYLIFMSVEHAIAEILTNGTSTWNRAIKTANYFIEEAENINGIKSLKAYDIVDEKDILGIDPTRVTLNVKDTGFTGHEIAGLLTKEAGIIPEMASQDVVLFLVSPEINEKTVDHALEGIDSIIKNYKKTNKITSKHSTVPNVPRQGLTPREAFMKLDRVRLPVSQAVGRVSVETIGCYPPGSAIICAGEIVTLEAVQFLRNAVAAGAHLKRANDDGFKTILVSRSTFFNN
ncbi:MAG: DegT/DnrJ/EryC1/StrS family aminotransferase [Desulfamplus sp.]|nr:DegT/DnrJ/EryC1/StrS family aminotransferase [Desulfamplus sp.]